MPVVNLESQTARLETPSRFAVSVDSTVVGQVVEKVNQASKPSLKCRQQEKP